MKLQNIESIPEDLRILSNILQLSIVLFTQPLYRVSRFPCCPFLGAPINTGAHYSALRERVRTRRWPSERASERPYPKPFQKKNISRSERRNTSYLLAIYLFVRAHVQPYIRWRSVVLPPHQKKHRQRLSSVLKHAMKRNARLFVVHISRSGFWYFSW